MTTWRVERITGSVRDAIAQGTIPAGQDHDDTAIAIATKVGNAIRRGRPAAQAAAWVDITSALGRRYEARYPSTAEDWFEVREEVAAALADGAETALVHRGEHLHITFTSA